jgi:protocatechuate 3,4-dioxygenase beta subunit
LRACALADNLTLILIKSLPIGFLGLILFAATGWAQVSILEGKVTGADGRLLQGAEVRIDRQDKKEAPVVVKTDANGRYASKTVSVGTYMVSVVVNGTVKTALRNVRVRGRATRLEFD